MFLYVVLLLVQSNCCVEQQPTSSVPPGQSFLPSHLLQGSIHLVSVLSFGISGYTFGQAMWPREQTIQKIYFEISVDRWLKGAKYVELYFQSKA